MMSLSLALMYGGFIALSLTMERHRKVVWQYKTQTRRQVFCWRFAGYMGLIGSGIIHMQQQGIAVGIVFWTGMLTAVAIIHIILITYKPQWLVRIYVIIFTIGIALFMLESVT